MTEARPGVLVHGGAGAWPADRLAEGVKGCEEAASRGAAVLAKGALAAVVEAVKSLEENPTFNAGVGAALTREGTVELDAGIMTGDLRFGAIAACPPVASAIEAALKIYEEGEHTLLAGDAAALYVSVRGVATISPEALITQRAQDAFEKIRDRVASGMTWREAMRKPLDADREGTVGAVAVDASGVLAAATSTGGITFQRMGRVGDTPLPGAGTYADQFRGGAASATGHGESIMRVLLSREAVERLAQGSDVATSAQGALDLLHERTGAKAGVILIDNKGNAHAAFNAKAMPWALARKDEEVESGG